ncbi:hypothetical protein TRIP_C20911 [Candidatus Zixiibacteriota bacterium]|nr:hypothetical protein TRIP_C20911 [candidate division Zixibacteria bacterium]
MRFKSMVGMKVAVIYANNYVYLKILRNIGAFE